MPKKKFFAPAELAEEWSVTDDKVIDFIKSGELEAVNLALSKGGKPRYRISEAAVEKFLADRAIRTKPKDTPKPRRQTAGAAGVRTYY